MNEYTKRFLILMLAIVLLRLIAALFGCSFDYDSHYYQHDKCLLNEQCVTEGMQIYDPGIENCPSCLECAGGVWIEIDCGEFDE